MSPRNGLSRRERRKRRRVGMTGARFPSPELSENLPEPRDGADPVVDAADEDTTEDVAEITAAEPEVEAVEEPGDEPGDEPAEGPEPDAVAEAPAVEDVAPDPVEPADGAEAAEGDEASEEAPAPEAVTETEECSATEESAAIEEVKEVEDSEKSEETESAEVGDSHEAAEVAEVVSADVDEPAPAAAALTVPADDHDDFADLDVIIDARSWVRPYVWTGGRTEASADLELETLVSARRPADELDDLVRDEHRRVLEVCAAPCSVSEVAAHLSVPLGVAKTLVSVLAEQDMVMVHSTAGASETGPDLALMERVLRGLRNL